MTTSPYDSAEYLDDELDVMGFLEIAMEDNDAAHIDRAFQTVTRSAGWAEIMRRTGMTSEQLTSAFSVARAATFDAFAANLQAAGLAMRIERLAA